MIEKTAMIKFEVEGRPVSLNQIYTKHWSSRSQAKQILWWQIKVALLKAKVPHNPILTAVEIDFVFYVKRPIDVDNTAGTAKMIIDYLREWGLLRNDSPKYVKKLTLQVITGQDREYAVVTIL